MKKYVYNDINVIMCNDNILLMIILILILILIILILI